MTSNGDIESLPEHIHSLHSGNKLIRHASYIGSFPVSGNDQKSRSEFVHIELEKMRNSIRSKSVQLWITLTGIKVCSQDGSTVYMAHALRRISYATCDPDFCQFSFLAREPKSQANIQYCHAFITESAEISEQLNNIVGDAFKLAYALQKQHERNSQPTAAPRSNKNVFPSSSRKNSLDTFRNVTLSNNSGMSDFKSSYGNPVVVLKECIDLTLSSTGGPPFSDSTDSTITQSSPQMSSRSKPLPAIPQNGNMDPPPLPQRYDSLRADVDDCPASWYQSQMPRDVALDILSQEDIGGFLVRDSSTHPNCYALSVKVPKYDNPTGIAHYLIQRTVRGVKLKGLDKEWPSLQALVCHLSVMPELLPCTLKLPRQQANPVYADTQGTNISDELQQSSLYGFPPDEDYQKLSDFSSILAELRI